MVDFSIILAGLGDAFTAFNLMMILFGVILGQFVGAVPGIGPVMAMAIAIPFTFALDPLVGISFLVGVNKGGLVGGAIPAVLMNTPGTPDAAATALDGYPLARQGKPLKATKMALFSSVTGDTFSDIALITVSAPLALIALRMGPVEIMALLIFAFSILSGLVGQSIIKGLLAACVGLMLAFVGSDPADFTPRLMFGYWEFFDGLPLIPVAIGSLAIAEILRRLAQTTGTSRGAIELIKTGDPNDQRVSWSEYWSCRFVLLRGAAIGTFLGALPGIGTTAAAYMSYATTKARSHEPETFGKGNIQGIAASESANSAVMGANLIPLLTLGIPGNVSAALIISAFVIHGIQPGPLLFETQSRLVYGLFGAMIIANFFNLWVGQLGLRFWVKVISSPESIVFASAMVLCFVGVSMAANGIFGIVLMLGFAIFGYLFTSFGYPLVIMIIAFFLGPRFEVSIVQSLSLMGGDLTQIYRYPVAVIFLILAPIVVYLFLRNREKTELE